DERAPHEHLHDLAALARRDEFIEFEQDFRVDRVGSAQCWHFEYISHMQYYCISTAGEVRNRGAFSIQSIRSRAVAWHPRPRPGGVQSPKELVRIFRRFDHRNAGCVEEFMDNKQEPGRQAETPVAPRIWRI